MPPPQGDRPPHADPSTTDGQVPAQAALWPEKQQEEKMQGARPRARGPCPLLHSLSTRALQQTPRKHTEVKNQQHLAAKGTQISQGHPQDQGPRDSGGFGHPGPQERMFVSPATGKAG